MKRTVFCARRTSMRSPAWQSDQVCMSKWTLAPDSTRPRAVTVRLRVPLSGSTIGRLDRSEEHTSELQSLMRISYAVFCLKKKNKTKHQHTNIAKPYIPQHKMITIISHTSRTTYHSHKLN